MQVAKWGNSLAVRIPQAVVEALKLKEGDEIEITIAGMRRFEIGRDRTREEALQRIRALESVRKHQTGLQSFRSMRRIEARRKNASALRLRFSQSLASLRQRLSQAMVRSTIQRLGRTANPLT